MYQVVESQIMNVNGQQMRSYGIQCKTHLIEDICFDKERMQSLVQTMNEMELEPRHLDDMVEDFLLQNYRVLG